MALTRGPVLIEYIGPNEGPLNMTWGNQRSLHFTPKKAYGNRRIEQFSSEKLAENFLLAHNKPSVGKINFQLAEGLILEQDQKAIRKLVENSVGKMTEAAIEGLVGSRVQAIELKLQAVTRDLERLEKVVETLEGAVTAPASKEAS